jgi:hypothetical protein
MNAPYRSGPSRTWIKVKNPKARRLPLGQLTGLSSRQEQKRGRAARERRSAPLCGLPVGRPALPILANDLEMSVC